MRILLTDSGKRFNRDWIFRHFNYEFQADRSYAIIGPNGSGKSTLLQVLSGGMMLSQGKCQWAIGNGQLAMENKSSQIETENIYKHISICAPYLEVVEEMTIKEFFEFHHHFKPLLSSITISEIIERIGLKDAIDKQIRNYSSGMKQRVKLAQAIYSDVPIVLLDEPCTNLDESGIELYHDLVKEYCLNRLLIVSSNDKVEYEFCDKQINILEYKRN